MQDSSGNYLPVIRWANNPPDNGVKVSVKYTGSAISGTDDGNGDIFNFSMSRTDTDTTIYSSDINDQPLYSTFSGGLRVQKLFMKVSISKLLRTALVIVLRQLFNG